ncbi:hypothetical protein EGW08_011615, partial [Elysia chlorotica]
GISLSWFALFTREDDQFGLVLLKTLNVLLLRLDRHVTSAIVHSNANTTCCLFVNSSRLKCGEKWEHILICIKIKMFVVILEGRTSDNRSEKSSNGPGRNSSGFFSASYSPTFSSHGLVEPCLNHGLPILVEMAIGHNVIPFGSHG